MIKEMNLHGGMITYDDFNLEMIENQPSNNIDKLPLVFNEINFLLLQIKYCESLKEANVYFDLLDKIQLLMAKLFHKYHLDLPSGIYQFIVDFDALHDQDERERLFTLIKNNFVSYENNSHALLIRVLQEINDDSVKSRSKLFLPYLEQEIDHLIGQIHTSKNIAEANIYFDLLQKTQEMVSELAYKYEIQVTKRLRKFIGDYDRLDDEDEREYLFKLIKNDQYSLDNF